MPGWLPACQRVRCMAYQLTGCMCLCLPTPYPPCLQRVHALAAECARFCDTKVSSCLDSWSEGIPQRRRWGAACWPWLLLPVVGGGRGAWVRRERIEYSHVAVDPLAALHWF
jgi:hypothetical protein